MSEWKEYKLGEIVSIASGFAYKGEHIGQGENLLLGMGCVSYKEKFLISGARPYSGDCAERYHVHAGDIVLATRQQSDNLPILGMPAIIPNELKEKKLIAGANLYRVTNNSDFDNKYIYWLLKTPAYVRHIASCKTGTTVGMITKADIENFVFVAPDKSGRERILEIITSLDDKIDLLNRENATLEAMAETLFRQWFVEEVKEEWEKKPLKEVVDIAIGRTPPRKESKWFSTNPNDIKWLSIKDMGDDSVFLFNTSEYLTKEAVEVYSIPIIPKNTVVLSFKMTVGRVGITTEDMLSNEAIAHFKFRDNTPFSKEYLYLFLKSFRYDTLGSTSSIVTAINSAMIKNMEIPIPDTDTMERYRNQTQPMFDKIYSNQEQINTLIQTRDGLLPRLMSNEIAL